MTNMMIDEDACPDQSVTYLADLGYCVVKVPSSDVEPYLVIGQQVEEFKDKFSHLGQLDSILSDPPHSPMPQVQTNVTMADIDGQTTDNITGDVGLNILSVLIAALGGGQLGAAANFKDVYNFKFTFQNVTADEISPVDVGKYVAGRKVDNSNVVVQQYTGSSGKMFLVTEVVKSNKFTVECTNDTGGGVSVNVPATLGIQGDVKVNIDHTNPSKISFEGPKPLTFGFQCFKLIQRPDVTLTLHPEGPGDVWAVRAPGQFGSITLQDRLMDVDKGFNKNPPAPVILSPHHVISFKPVQPATKAAS